MGIYKEKTNKGLVLDIQRFSIHDGPGIRTTVFLMGCPLRCLWCHNPESNQLKPGLSFIPEKCKGCGYCFQSCPLGLHKTVEGVHVIDREKCTGCGICTLKCYTGALEMAGREMTVAEVMEEVMRDKRYYDNSGGGMTLSGGEPFLQHAFACELLKDAHAKGLHTAVETSGYTDFGNMEVTLPFTDLYLYDYKETDPCRHKAYTGVSNERILENLHKLDHAGARIILRCPIIPGLNDRQDHFDAITAHARKLKNLDGVEILAYHRLGVSKTARFGLEKDMHPEFEAPDKKTAEAWRKRLELAGIKVIRA